MTDLILIKYPEIENSHREKFISQIKNELLTEGNWLVLEKVHGAHCSFISNGDEIRMAKRNNFIEGNEDFFDWENTLARHRNNIFTLFHKLKREYSPLQQIIVEGEIYGGTYNHPKVQKVKGVKKIQKGIFYSPGNSFIAYDIRIMLTGGELFFLNYPEATTYLKESDIPYIPVIFTGSFDEAIRYPNDFESGIHKLHELPGIEDNTCEGIVIRPEHEKKMGNGSRVILKSKNEKWEEKIKRKRPDKIPLGDQLSEEGKNILENLLLLVNENRINSVISKMGEVTKDDFGTIMKETYSDVIKDFTKDNKIELEKKELGVVNKLLNKKVVEIVKKTLS